MLTTMDAETERHRQSWLGFVRFMKIMITLVVVILGGMAIFLL
jgi:Bacterial aa3 type cytochrome c oxidase subunit IV